ncbi:MAG: hypothetical protein LUD07_10850 [Clostridiales bacterium]|nr:hypothetical protein [Clostridiales bacterium]
MDRDAVFDRFARAFEAYYNVRREEIEPPFDAEAEFHSHDEQFFLVRSATISEAESNDYVYFASRQKLDEELLQELDKAAWERGLAKVKPHANHRNSDITLIILADTITESAAALAPKLRRYKSYRFSFHGWTHYRLLAVELSSGMAYTNRQGRDLKKLVRMINNGLG